MFKKRKLICILFLFSCIFICMSFVSADNITNDTSYNNDNNTPIVVDSPTKSFSDLKNEIYDLNKSEIILEDDYVNQKVYDDYNDYYPQSDMIIIVERVTTGILINRSVNIDGQGHIIDANNLSEIFYLNADNITLKNIVFKNAHGDNFGAVFCNTFNISIINCTFINNYGFTGAVYCNNQNISIINSTFINNTGPLCAAIRCQVPIDIINSTFINNNGNYDYSGVYSPVICSCKGGRIINSTFIDNYVYNSDEEKYAGIYYYDMIFNVVNETITYSENSNKVRSIITGNYIIINSTFKNTLTHNIHYYRQLLILNGDNNNTTETSNNSRSNNQSTTENNINSTNNASINKTSDVSEHVVPVNFNVDNNMSQITPTITIIANNTYVINGADDIVEIGFKTNIKNKMFWVEILGLLSKTDVTSNEDFCASIKLSNITKGGEYTILCGFNDYVKPVVVGSDEIIGVADKKTIHINNNNSTSNNQSTIENNTNLTNNTDANKTTRHNTEDITENDINNLSVPSNNSDIGSDNKNQTSSVQNQPITPVVKTSLLFKPVNVKKTAKKLVLQIVLKQGSKLLKGKKITFMFNGKKYTAKTNKKGIAKVIIKKKVLKKLKVGKKVKYQVSYGKIVAKKTAKVRK